MASSALDYASGTINPGASVTVTLSKPGIYLIGCAFHYIELNMRDVIRSSPARRRDRRPRRGRAVTARRRTAATRATTLVQHRARRSARPFVYARIVARPAAGYNLHIGALHRRVPADQRRSSRTPRARIAHLHLTARLLTITLDPEHDSPRTMRELARASSRIRRIGCSQAARFADVHEVMHRVRRSFGRG